MTISNCGPTKICLLVLLLASGGARGLFAQGLGDSTQRVVFESSAFSGPSTALPNWSNGYLVSREMETFQEGTPNVRWYDRLGKQVGSASIWFPGAQRLLIYAAVAAPDKTIIAGGKAEKADGANGPFIAKVDATGKVLAVIQTQGFYPENICGAPDGTVWSFGGTGFDANSNPVDGSTIRHFDFQKGQLDSHVPRSSFPKPSGPAILAGISCGADSLTVYSSKASQLIVLRYGASAPQLYSVDVPSGLKFTGFAVIGASMYASISQAGKGGLYLLSKDDATQTARWVPLVGTVGPLTAPGVITELWGADSPNLVVSRSDDATGMAALHWAAPLN